MVEGGFVSVYRAQDEVTANIVKAALEDAGIPAFVKSYQVPWYDSALVPAKGCWGEILVREEDAERASSLLEEYAGGEEES